MLSRLRGGLLLLLLVVVVALTWQVQAWRYGQQLAALANAHALARQLQAETLANELRAARQQRQVLEQQIQVDDQSHFQELLDAQQSQARLRDRLATADLRLSVLVGAHSAPAVSATAATSSVDHGPVRARLDSAHAQRIIAITGQGDQGLIALRACQAYVQALQR